MTEAPRSMDAVFRGLVMGWACSGPMDVHSTNIASTFGNLTACRPVCGAPDAGH